MTDRYPGLTWDNPIWHGEYRIYADDRAGTSLGGYAYTHDDYDGAEDGNDQRHGWERTVDAAKAAIDLLEEELADERQAHSQFGVGA